MTRSRIPTQAELDTALWLDGHAAIKVAEVAHGAPGWPPLLQLLAGGGWREVPLADAQADRERGWPLDWYMYPVPRERVERMLSDARAVAGGVPYGKWHEHLAGALKGDAESTRAIALQLAAADRRAVAS